MRKPEVNVQGKAVIERCGECDWCQEWILEPTQAQRADFPCSDLLIMLPNGEVRRAPSNRKAERLIRDWYKREMNLDAVNVGLIEWRHNLWPPSKTAKKVKR